MGNYKLLCAIIWIFYGFWSLTVTATSNQPHSTKLPSFLKICRRNDPNLNECARNALYSLKERLPYGIPELYIPATEPLVIPEIKMNQDTGVVYVKSIYKNVKIYGLSNFTIKSINVEPTKMKFNTVMAFSNITINADYMIDGKIMMMPLTGSGPCNAHFSDVILSTVVMGEREKKNNRNYFKIKDININYDIGKVKVNLNDLFHGDNALSERMNAFLNANWDSLSEELKPLLQKSLTEVVKSSTDKLFKTYSVDDLLPL